MMRDMTSIGLSALHLDLWKVGYSWRLLTLEATRKCHEWGSRLSVITCDICRDLEVWCEETLEVS